LRKYFIAVPEKIRATFPKKVHIKINAMGINFLSSWVCMGKIAFRIFEKSGLVDLFSKQGICIILSLSIPQ
jgi:hypothetical protein